MEATQGPCTSNKEDWWKALGSPQTREDPRPLQNGNTRLGGCTNVQCLWAMLVGLPVCQVSASSWVYMSPVQPPDSNGRLPQPQWECLREWHHHWYS